MFLRKTKNGIKKILFFGVDCSIINAKVICDLIYRRDTPTITFKERIVKYIFIKIEESKQKDIIKKIILFQKI